MFALTADVLTEAGVDCSMARDAAPSKLDFDTDSSEWGPAEWLAISAAMADPRGWRGAHIVERRMGTDGDSYVAIQATAWVPEAKGGQARRNSRRALRRALERDPGSKADAPLGLEAANPMEGGTGLDGASREGDAPPLLQARQKCRGGKTRGRRRGEFPSEEEEWEAMLFGVPVEDMEFGTEEHKAKWHRTGGPDYSAGEPAGSRFPPGFMESTTPEMGPQGPCEAPMKEESLNSKSVPAPKKDAVDLAAPTKALGEEVTGVEDKIEKMKIEEASVAPLPAHLGLFDEGDEVGLGNLF